MWGSVLSALDVCLLCVLWNCCGKKFKDEDAAEVYDFMMTVRLAAPAHGAGGAEPDEGSSDTDAEGQANDAANVEDDEDTQDLPQNCLCVCVLKWRASML